MALLGQVETAKANTVIEFKASQPFIDSCAVYYEDGFEDYLKQVKSIYAHLDLSKVFMDDPIPSTPAGDNIFEETDDSIQSERDPKNDGVVLAQLAVEKPVTLVTPSIEAQLADNPPTQNVQDPSKDDEKLPALESQESLMQFFYFYWQFCNVFHPFSRQC